MDAPDMAEHQSVLLEPAIDALVTDTEGLYVDGTFGRGGHSRALLQRLGAAGRLVGIDKDPQAVAAGHALAAAEPRFSILQGSFAAMATLMATHQDSSPAAGAPAAGAPVAGVLLDLGVSSPQLDQAERGFSFLRDGELDMRMDPSQGESAADWLAHAAEADMVRVLKEYGEERYARRIVRAILAARAERPITRTRQLADIVAAAHPAWEPGRHPATQTFQAIRIYINNELQDLERGLTAALDVLQPGGRLVVISFHSLEDRIVKRFIRDQARGPQLPAYLPIVEQDRGRRLRALGKAQRSGADEVAVNPRARSAVMRVAEKLS